MSSIAVAITTDDVEKFLDLKEEEFKGFDYEKDKSSQLVNRAFNDRQLSDGIDFVNIAKLLTRAFGNKSSDEQMRMKPSEVLPLVFQDSFFEVDLGLDKSDIITFLEFIDNRMKTGELLKKDKEFQLIDFLINESKEFKNDLKD